MPRRTWSRRSGNVQVTRGERRLLADTLRYDQDTDQMEAEGNVALLEPTGDTLFADRVTLSGDLREGVAEQLRARLVDNSLIAAEGGRRTAGNRTELDRAVFSPCPLCPELGGAAAVADFGAPGHPRSGGPEHLLPSCVLRARRRPGLLPAVLLSPRSHGQAPLGVPGSGFRQRQRARAVDRDPVLFCPRPQLRCHARPDLLHPGEPGSERRVPTSVAQRPLRAFPAAARTAANRSREKASHSRPATPSAARSKAKGASSWTGIGAGASIWRPPPTTPIWSAIISATRTS